MLSVYNQNAKVVHSCDRKIAIRIIFSLWTVSERLLMQFPNVNRKLVKQRLIAEILVYQFWYDF